MCLITPTLLSLSLSLSSSTRVYVFTLLCILSVDKLPAATTCRAGNPRPGHRHQHPPSVSRLPGPFSQNRQLLLSVGSNDFCRVVFFVLLLLLLFFFLGRGLGAARSGASSIRWRFLFSPPVLYAHVRCYDSKLTFPFEKRLHSYSKYCRTQTRQYQVDIKGISEK